MQEIVQTLGTPEMVTALEANLEEEMISFGRGLVGGEIYNDGEIEGFFTGRGYLNGILRTHLRETRPGYIEERIKAVLSYFRDKGVKEISWSLGQDCLPANMAMYLEQHGFKERREFNIGMALDMAELQGEKHEVAGLVIREIEDREELKHIKRMEIECFGSPEELAQDYYEMYVGMGFGKGTAWRHFGGWQKGELVASTALLFYAGVAGIFNVATLSQARRQGIAQLMVRHAIRQAQREGYRVAILSPTEMSAGIYQRLGFREYTKIRHYTCEW